MERCLSFLGPYRLARGAKLLEGRLQLKLARQKPYVYVNVKFEGALSPQADPSQRRFANVQRKI